MTWASALSALASQREVRCRGSSRREVTHNGKQPITTSPFLVLESYGVKGKALDQCVADCMLWWVVDQWVSEVATSLHCL